MKYLSQFSSLSIAVTISVALHAALLVVQFAAPELLQVKPSDPGLEVILVNAKHAKAPLKADALAQADLDGGGQADAGRSRSPLPDMKHSEMGESFKATQRRVAELEAQQQNLLTQSRSSGFYAAPVTDQEKPDPARSGDDVIETRKAIARKEAEIHERIEDENKRPRKTLITPSVRKAGYALYYKDMQRKVEEIGTLNFPQKAGKKLYGELVVYIPIFEDGTIYEKEGGVRIERSSGNRDLDKAALAIVRRSAPFGKFPRGMLSSDRDDLWVIITRFNFTREDKLEAELK